MVTIKKIEIKWFFGKGDFEWNLDPYVNILGGKNGSGKSTIFKLCHTLLTNENIYQSQEEWFSKLFKKVVLTFSNGWTLTCDLSEKAEYVLDLSKSQAFRSASVIRDQDGNKRGFSEFQHHIRVFTINSFEQHVAAATQYESQPKIFPLDDPTMLDLMIKDQIDSRNRDFSKVMEEIYDSSEEDDTTRIDFIRTHKLIYKSLEHFLTEYDKPYKSSFTFSKNNGQFGYEKLSMGEKQVLLLLLMVSNTKQQPCIFFMDEPDLSMHIDWKEILVTELHELNPNMQIILSTHSPSVITGWHDKVKEVDQLIK